MAEHTVPDSEVFWDNVSYLIEIPGVYDGWSVAVMQDGSVINRWRIFHGSEFSKRADATEAWLRERYAD